MRIKKKTLYIVLPISILVVFILLLFVFLMGWFGNTPKLNRYDSLIQTCEVEKKFFKVLVRCDALINTTSQKDNKNCLDLTVVNKENTNILPLEVCESNKVLDISDPVLDTDMKIPMHMVFEYTYLPPLSYGISDISMELMEDNTAIGILLKLKEKGISIRDVRIQESVEMNTKGYYFTEFKNDEGKSYLGTVTFTETKINSISVEGNDLIIGLSIIINGLQREYEFRENWLGYLDDSDSSQKIRIDKNNKNDLDLNKAYNITFLYIPLGSPINKEYFDTNCDVEDIMYEVLCIKRDSIEELKLDTDLETYLKGNDLSKLTLDYVY